MVKSQTHNQTHITHFTRVLLHSPMKHLFSPLFTAPKKDKIDGVTRVAAPAHVKIQLLHFLSCKTFLSSKTEGLLLMHPAHFFGLHPNKPMRYGQEISENLRNWAALGQAGKASNEWAGEILCNREKIKCQSQSFLFSAFPVFLSPCVHCTGQPSSSKDYFVKYSRGSLCLSSLYQEQCALFHIPQ